MDIASFHASRRFADVKSGRIAYFERGQGPAALFIHGVPVNGYHWRHVIDRVHHLRRCIAIDLMGLGYTEIGPSQDVSFTTQAHMIAEVLDALGIDKIDLVGNDSGGAIAQIFAAHYPHRLTSLVLTNCDVHDGWPPPQVLPLMEHSRNGTLASVFQPTLDRPDLARQRKQRHGRHSRRAKDAQGSDPDRVGPQGHLLRQEVGVLAEGHHTGCEARRGGRRCETVLPGRSPGCAGCTDARILE